MAESPAPVPNSICWSGALPMPGRTRVTYEARLEPGGLARLADPLLGLLFPWTGARAVPAPAQDVLGQSA